MDAFLAVLRGLPLTLLVTIVAFAFGLVAAAPLALGLRSRILPLAVLCRVIVDLVRGIPIIVWLFILKFGLRFDPDLGSPYLRSVPAAVLGLGLVSTAYLAEIYRGGIQTVPRGQFEAAGALGIGSVTAFFRIIAPQALRTVSPSVATYFIGLFKDSSIASTIIVAEMVFQAQSYGRQNPTVAGILPYVFAGMLYIVLSLPVAWASRKLEARLSRGQEVAA